MPRFFIRNEKTKSEQVLNLPQDVITIGREASCDIELPEKGVSRKHTEILREGENYFLVDLKSGNGTFLNGQKVRPIEKHLLHPNDRIKIEDFEITFTSLDEALSGPVEEDTDTDIVEVKMIKKVLKALNKEAHPSLEVLNGTAEGKKVYFTDEMDELIIGRDPDVALSIDAAVISRNHAKLVRKWGGVVLIDLESRNGSYINNEKIQEKQLHDGDKILLGTIKLIYRNPQDVNIEAIGEEIARKKQEAALREAEMIEIARQKEEEEAKLREEEERIKREQEEAERLEREKEEQAKAEEAAKAAEAALAEQKKKATVKKPVKAKSGGLSLVEKILFGLGGFIVLLVIAAIVMVVLK